jgi:zinc protease
VVATVFPRGDLEAELRNASARMGDLRVTADDLARERPRVLDEVSNMFGRFPALGAMNNARELIRPSPQGGRKGGLPEHIRNITVEDVRAHWGHYYKPRNAILVLAGAVDAGAVRKAVTEHFDGIAPGEEVPAAPEPGKPKFGAVREFAVKSSQPQAQSDACLAYDAPEPGSDLYAPFLVLVTRLWACAGKLGGGPGGLPVYFTPLDDGAVVAVSTPAKRGETAAQAFAGLEAFVAEAVEPKLVEDELATVRQTFGFLLGTTSLPDPALATTPYGVAISLGRREQLGIDPAKLGRALGAVTDQELRRAANEVFTPSRHAGALIRVEN